MPSLGRGLEPCRRHSSNPMLRSRISLATNRSASRRARLRHVQAGSRCLDSRRTEWITASTGPPTATRLDLVKLHQSRPETAPTSALRKRRWTVSPGLVDSIGRCNTSYRICMYGRKAMVSARGTADASLLWRVQGRVTKPAARVVGADRAWAHQCRRGRGSRDLDGGGGGARRRQH